MNEKRDLAVSSIIKISKPNEIISIYKGELKFKVNDKLIAANGEIYFKWFPHLRTEFITELVNINFDDSLFENDNIEIIVGGNSIGNCYISSENIGETHTIKGAFFNHTIFGDKTLTANNFKFSILNFDDFLGEIIEYPKENSKSISKARIKKKNERKQ